MFPSCILCEVHSGLIACLFLLRRFASPDSKPAGVFSRARGAGRWDLRLSARQSTACDHVPIRRSRRVDKSIATCMTSTAEPCASQQDRNAWISTLEFVWLILLRSLRRENRPEVVAGKVFTGVCEGSTWRFCRGVGGARSTWYNKRYRSGRSMNRLSIKGSAMLLSKLLKQEYMKTETIEVLHANRDPLSGALGAHPVGTGIGALAGGAAAGAAIGSVAGPVGTVVGMAAGAIAGGLAGKAVAETIDPTVEDAYWRATYTTRSYVDKASPFDIYQPAYRIGYEGYGRYPGKRFQEVEIDLQRDYEKAQGKAGLEWKQAKHATRDAWLRLEKRCKQKA